MTELQMTVDASTGAPEADAEDRQAIYWQQVDGNGQTTTNAYCEGNPRIITF